MQSEPVAGEEPQHRGRRRKSAGDFGFAETTHEQSQNFSAPSPETEPAPPEFVAEEHTHDAAETSGVEEPGPSPEAGAVMFGTIAEGEQPSAAAEGALTSDAAPVDPANGNGEEHPEGEAVESVGGADALEEVQERAAAVPPPVQDSRSHQAPAGDVGAGRQGRARHQGRGIDNSICRSPAAIRC